VRRIRQESGFEYIGQTRRGGNGRRGEKKEEGNRMRRMKGGVEVWRMGEGCVMSFGG